MLHSLRSNRDLFRRFLMVAIPIIIQNAITNFVSMLDNIMVGQVGSLPMSGVSIVNNMMFVYSLCIFGASSGAGIFTAQFFGCNDHEGIRHTFRFKLLICTALSLIGVVIFTTFDTQLISLYLQGEGNPEDAAEILRPYFFGARNELLYILCMDGKGKLLGVRKVSEGTIDAAEINTRRLLEEALSLRAAAIYVAHNHVSNLALPSSMDWIATDRLRDLLAGVGIALRDHLIFVDDDFVSIGASDPRYRNATFDIT